MRFRVGLIVLLLSAGIFLLIQLDNQNSPTVFANAPAVGVRAPAAPSTIFLPFVAKNQIVPPMPLWRFGASKAFGQLTDYDPLQTQALRLGWYSDWTVSPTAPQPYGIEYVPTVRIKQWKQYDALNWTTWCVTCAYVSPYTYTVSPDRSVIQSFAATRPGMTWIIGNEIERIDWSNGGRQDEILPEVYAIAYNEMYALIKSADATAQIAIGGMVQATPLRLQYLDRVWTGYQSAFAATMPVDVWNIHAFVLPEKSCVAYPTECFGADIPAGISATVGMTYTASQNKDFTIAWGHIQAMRSWMANKGERNKPLIIAEYGVNYPPDYAGFSYADVRDSFMYPSFNYFLNQTNSSTGFISDTNHLVQRWNWYSLDDDSGFWQNSQYFQNYNGNLFYSGSGGNPKGLTSLGWYWTQYVKPLAPGATKPYAPQRSAPSTRAAPSRIASAVDPARCEPSQRVRLLYYAPTARGASKLEREDWVCAPQ